MKKIDIGKLIQVKMDEEGRSAKWLAKKINCHRNNIYRIYKKKYVHAQILAQISIALRFNFFSYYYNYINEQITNH
ncbi:MAG: XRE family transcriptional regulator [Bacteroidales bacterium]|jgi:plasmid maintenance system antidote protein VapI|nr:XRE family transcriptional regulator [Bacteroidales bacterium]